MKNKTGYRFLSILLTLALLLGCLPVTAFADDGCTHVCGDETCDYIEGADCGYVHEHDENCGYDADAGSGCTDAHEHDIECGYIEGADCNHVHDENCGGLSPADGLMPGNTITFDMPEGEYGTAFYLPENKPVTDADLLAGVTATDENGDPVTVTVKDIDGLNMQNPAPKSAVYPNPPYVITYVAAHTVSGDEFTETRECYVTAAAVPMAPGNTETVGDINYKITTMPVGGSRGTVSVDWHLSYTGSATLIIPPFITVTGSNAGDYDVTAIDDSAFQGCNNLQTVTIPDSVKSIGNMAFWGCTGIQTVTIGNGVTTISPSAFSSCTSLMDVTVASGNQNYSSLDGVLFNKDKSTLLLYPAKKNGADYTIPDSVTSIAGAAFEGCANLQTVTIPDSVNSIGSDAFQYCANLQTVTIGNGVTSIDSCAFEGCANLQTVIIGNSVDSIGGSAFLGCGNLQTVIIPDSVTSIGDNAFQDCSSLQTVAVGNGVTSIGNSAFDGCTSLTNIAFSRTASPTVGINVFWRITNPFTIMVPTGSEIGYGTAFSGNLANSTIKVGYAVTFDLNGGTHTGGGALAQAVLDGGSATAPDVTRAGYTFNGWDKIFTTVAQTLTVTAQWTQNLPPTPPPAPAPQSSGRKSSGRSGNTGNQKAPAPRPITMQEALDAFAKAIASLTTGQTSVTVRFVNCASIPLDVLKALADAAKKEGVTVIIHADTVSDGAVQTRLYIDPAKSSKGITLAASADSPDAVNAASRFKGRFKNKLTAVSTGQQGSFGQPVEIAVKVDLSGMDTENLVFYSYDSKTNTYKRIEKPAYWVDKNGYLHFTTELAGDIIISDGPLEKKS